MNKDLSEKEKMTLQDFIDHQTRKGLSFGRISTEITHSDNEGKEFHTFRPVDIGQAGYLLDNDFTTICPLELKRMKEQSKNDSKFVFRAMLGFLAVSAAITAYIYIGLN